MKLQSLTEALPSQERDVPPAYRGDKHHGRRARYAQKKSMPEGTTFKGYLAILNRDDK